MDGLRKSGNSVGARVDVVARNVPAGLGAPIYGKLDADIASAMMGINAAKGVEIGAGFAADVVEDADVGMFQVGDGLRFALEALLRFRVRGRVGRQDLDGHGPIEPRVAGLVDLAHPARAGELEDLVGSETRA